MASATGAPSASVHSSAIPNTGAGRWPLAAGRWPLAAGRWPLAAGQSLIVANPMRQYDQMPPK
ncbi:hypothetical protein GCM10022245_30060 [Streptomyces mayteni]